METTLPETEARAAVVFNGTYTVESPKGGHRTLRIKTQDAEAKFAPGQRIVALLTGPDNVFDYTGFGFVDDTGIRVWRTKQGTQAQPSDYEWMARMLWDLATKGEASRYYQIGYRLLAEATCLKCNRKLTTPESIRRGIGPVCAAGGWD